MTTARSTYREPGMQRSGGADDPGHMNVHGALPTLWMNLAMLGMNLLVWLDTAMRVAG